MNTHLSHLRGCFFWEFVQKPKKSERLIRRKMSSKHSASLSLPVVLVCLLLWPHIAMRASAQSCTIGCASMRFKPLSAGTPYSFLYMNNQSNVTTMRSRVFPPIIVQILDSNGNVDSSTQSQDITIVVTSTARLATAGSSVAVVYGEAQILQLVVEGTDSVYSLTFTAVSGSAYPVSSNAATTALHIYNVTSILSPVNIFALVFAQNSTSVLYAGQPLTVVLGQLVPPITLNVVNSQYLTFPTSSTLGNTYTVQAVPSDPRIVVASGGTVTVLDGEALFDELILTGSTAVTSFASLKFMLLVGAATTPTSNLLTVATGTVTVASVVVDNSLIAFERGDTSFIASQGQQAYATAGVQLPPIRISTRNNILSRSPPTSGLVISASCLSPAEYTLAGAMVGVTNGIATFTNLTFDARSSGNIAIAFQAGAQGSLPLAQTIIYTGWITVLATVSKAAMMRFLPNSVDSYVNYPGQDIEAVLFSPIPAIRIQILDSSYNVDSTSTVFITAKSSTGLVSVTQQAGSGIVEFTTLQFTSSSAVSPRITFTATTVTNAAATTATLPLLGARLVTGVVTVAAVQANYDLRFQPYGVGLFVTQGQSSVATINVALPNILVELVTSAGTMDASSSDISITASASGATLSGNFIRVTNGVAIFDSLAFVSETPGSYILTFTAGAEDSSAVVGGKSITTGSIRVASGVTPAFALRFAIDGSSRLSFPGQVMPITLDTSYLVPVVVELIDSAHNVSTSTRPITITMSRSVGTILYSSPTKTLAALQSRVTYDTITIGAGYATVLTFTASGTTEAVNGQTVATGSLVVKTKEQAGLPAYLDITAASSTTGARGTTSINSGAAMTFTIQMKSGQLLNYLTSTSTSTSNYSVTASSSIPLRTPLVRTMNGAGVAVFSSLQFAQTVPRSALPVITFTASLQAGGSSSSTTSASAILSVSTGLITVIGPSLESGIDIVAQILFDFGGFIPANWIASLARRLNVETSRFLVTRVYYGTSADLATTTTATTSTTTTSKTTSSVNTTLNSVAVWYGTRLDLRILEPLATSRNTNPAWSLVNYILSIKPTCTAAPDLYIRKIMNLSADTTCDWFMFEDQMSSAQQCTLATGTSSSGFCACYLPVVQTLGLRCLGYSTLTDLCLNTLLADAQCTDITIVNICSLLKEEPVSRVLLLASGIFFGFLLIPLVYFRSSGFFHKLQRPDARASFSSTEKIRIDRVLRLLPPCGSDIGVALLRVQHPHRLMSQHPPCRCAMHRYHDCEHLQPLEGRACLSCVAVGLWNIFRFLADSPSLFPQQWVLSQTAAT
ncbi:membrane-associated protein, putative [Bodo saltans]|uniref:Membrane-associated protein, putative n=1 Tax=Bodo saltans TaxID=75058 RepID=A0A0S4JUF4_BODSA|nr:membrane-associated protein, putative [Bodo saltans]|eukprot:CUG93865.1 membrane-associated protein, putative [Bodo saltans]